MTAPLLEISGLVKHFPLRRTFADTLRGRKALSLRAVDGITLAIAPGEIVALVGESGSGKTTAGKLITLQERPDSGSIRFAGAGISDLQGAALTGYRRRVQMIFQNPYEALDPRYSILDSVMEPLAIHRIGNAASRRAAAAQALEKVELAPAGDFASRYPADLSGGQLQRVAIARALVLKPDLIVADEPVSMLDVSVRAGVMKLMLDLSRELSLAALYITHDLAVARAMSSRIAVMYLGAIVEEGPTETLMAGASHPYTQLLVGAVPDHRNRKRARIRLGGEPASLTAEARGCRFAPRCPRAQAVCRETPPQKVEISGSHWAACHFAGEAAAG